VRKERMISRFSVACVVAWLCCFLVGCGGDSFSRVAVSGTVTCEGIASPSGGVVATPAQSGTGAPNVSTNITDGKFSFPANQGPVPGSYIFEFSLEVPGAAAPAASESPEGERETGPTVTYRKTVEIPERGTESLSIELTPADLVREPRDV
jgi:hypothetical protein